MNASKQEGIASITKKYYTMHVMISELDPCVASVYTSISV